MLTLLAGVCPTPRSGIVWSSVMRRSRRTSLGCSPSWAYATASRPSSWRTAVGSCRSTPASLVPPDQAPTAAPGMNESAEVHHLVSRLREQGITVILISHNLEEIMTLATRSARIDLPSADVPERPGRETPGTETSPTTP